MNQYKAFETWLNKYLGLDISPRVHAVNFNLYEASRGETAFDVQLIGAQEYDCNDPDWACHAIFSSGEDLCPIEASDWEECLQLIIDYIHRYLSEGEYAFKLKGLLAVTVGFVDGDLEVIMEN